VKPIVLSFLATLLSLTPAALGQHSEGTIDWASLRFLTGKWVGEGSAETGQPGAGYCSFEPGLQGRVLVRKNHSEYPAAGGRPAIVHDDLMIIYPDEARRQLRAFYTDNEGNVIHYTVTAASDGKSAVFLGDAEPGARRFRLTYTLAQADRMAVNFEMAPPDKPDEFKKFIEGKLRKAPETN
jgi:hypothetical protein